MKKKKKHLRANTRNKPSSTLGESIRTLRIVYEETQEELAAAINVSPATIGNYEQNTRVPDPDTLKTIAQHYNVPIEMLKEGGFYSYSLEGLLERANKHVDVLFPLICSDLPLSNPLFEKAYHSQKEALLQITKLSTIQDSATFDAEAERLSSNFTIALECYSKLMDDESVQDEIRAAAALNFIPIFIITWATIPFSSIEGKVYQYQKGDISTAQLLLSYYDSRSSNDTLKAQKEIRDDEMTEFIWALLKEARQVPEWSDFVYYYIALLHKTNFVPCDFTESSELFGIEMMYKLARLGNQYAIDHLKVIMSIHG